MATSPRHHRRSVPPPAKICATCGRPFEWRRAWSKDWHEIRYCSEGCRRRRPGRFDRRLEAEILGLLDKLSDGSICPSEVARLVDPEDWRRLMEPVRRAARRLAAEGRVEITQYGKVVDAGSFRGPIRIRRPRATRS